MLGVSPSFFFSKYTTNFSIFDYIEGLDDLVSLGVDCFEGEIFKEEKIPEWEENAKLLKIAYEKKGLKMSTFVAHFIIKYTQTYESFFDDKCFEDIKRVCDIVKNNFDEVNTIVIPMGKFNFDTKMNDYDSLYKRVLFVIKKMANILKSYNLNLALEIIPNSIVGGVDGLIRLIEKTQCDNVGYNFDTGHAYCSGEILELIPNKLKNKIFGTHLKDNFGNDNLALPLGYGDINFKTIINVLKEKGYTGSFDLEFSSDRNNIIKDYSIGVNYLKQI